MYNLNNIGNLTFIVETHQADRFIEWLENRKAAIKEVMSHHGGQNIRVAKVAAMASDPDFVNHAASFSVQVEFQTLDSTESWLLEMIESFGEDFHHTFSGDSMIFPSILDVIDVFK